MSTMEYAAEVVLGSGWGRGARMGVQLIMLTNLCLRLIVCVCVYKCVHACVLNTDLTPATPTREFLSGFDRGRMSQQTNIYVHKRCKTGVAQWSGKLLCEGIEGKHNGFVGF